MRGVKSRRSKRRPGAPRVAERMLWRQWRRSQDRCLSKTARAVLQAIDLITFATGGNAQITVGKIAQTAGCTERMVQLLRPQLEASGYLEHKRCKRRNGGDAASEWRATNPGGGGVKSKQGPYARARGNPPSERVEEGGRRQNGGRRRRSGAAPPADGGKTVWEGSLILKALREARSADAAV